MHGPQNIKLYSIHVMPLLVSVIDGGNTITEHWLIDNDVGVERHSEETLVLVPLYQRGLA